MTEFVLVTGGSGYVAGWCIVELLRRGFDVRTTVRNSGKENEVRAAVSGVVDVDPGRLTFAVADLTADAGWDDAVDGVSSVLHVASPLGISASVAEDVLIASARDGAVRVLRAATAAKVRRVVMTSAANAASPSSYATDGVTDEELWTDPDDPTLIPYRRSKTLAERSAWDFMREQDGVTELTTVLPGAVFGPVLTTANLGSVAIIQRMISGRMRGVPRIGLEIVDVRDLADIHIRAMTSPAAGGERFLATGDFRWMREMAEVLHSGLGDRGRKVHTRQLPDFAVRLAARYLDPSLREITPALGRRNRHSTDKAQRVLGWEPRSPDQTVLDCARDLVEKGAV
ncbi:NAD-dependent epimerase/dehydratase family protein [Rhodococcus jostii]|uniref:Nucleoside-diphosphate-sugar epimerase n=1 Tax=Rhodococcus jostii TaxID=132919 RepID=A0A1H5E6G0_RHOJO|nr:NAD-dependent epimerase/dehydratase family protein [Rhodococcus jostii]SED86666.1 Nucleoside-diphosphate-sugar epimerase [Rhodococcus jostii]